MDGDAVRFRLADGELLVLPVEELRPLYEALWEHGRVKGAITAAVVVIETSRRHALGRPTSAIELNSSQSAVLRQAVARLHVSR